MKSLSILSALILGLSFALSMPANAGKPEGLPETSQARNACKGLLDALESNIEDGASETALDRRCWQLDRELSSSASFTLDRKSSAQGINQFLRGGQP